MLFQFDVNTLTVGIVAQAGAGLDRKLALADGHSAAPWAALLQMMNRVGVSQPAARPGRVMMVMVIDGQWILVALFLHGEVVVVATRLQRVDAMGGRLGGRTVMQMGYALHKQRAAAAAPSLTTVGVECRPTAVMSLRRTSTLGAPPPGLPHGQCCRNKS